MKSTSKILLLGAIVGSFCLSGCDSEYSVELPDTSVTKDSDDSITGVSITESVTSVDTGITLRGTTSIAIQNGSPTGNPTSTLSLSDPFHAGSDFTFTPSISTNLDNGTSTLGFGLGYSGTVGPNDDSLTVSFQTNFNLSTGGVSLGASAFLHF